MEGRKLTGVTIDLSLANCCTRCCLLTLLKKVIDKNTQKKSYVYKAAIVNVVVYLGKEVGLDGRGTGMSMLASSSGSPMLDSDSWLDKEGTGREEDCCSSGSCDPAP